MRLCFRASVTLPGPAGGSCPAVPFAALTAVGVHPTHRRQGLLRRLMGVMLADARSRGEVIAGLTASEASIYGRFGFGAATQVADYVIAARESAYAVPFPTLEMELLEPPEAAKLLPGVFATAIATQPGQVNRPDPVWAHIFEDHAEDRAGASAMSWVSCPGGYASWRTEEIHEPGRLQPQDAWGRARLREVVAENPEIEAALWRFVLDLDLVREVVAYARPLDEPLRARLVDPRQLRTTSVTDVLWLRVLDTAAALTTRGYLRPGRLVLDVRAPAANPVGPDGADGPDPAVGRWLLDADVDVAACRPAGRAERTDLVLGLADLGALLAGGVRASVLAAAGRVDEERLGAFDVADALFASRPAPLTITGF